MRVEDLDTYLPSVEEVAAIRALPDFKDFVKRVSEGYLTPTDDRAYVMHQSRRKFIYTQNDLMKLIGYPHRAECSEFSVKEFDKRNTQPDNAVFSTDSAGLGELVGHLPEYHGFLDFPEDKCMVGRTVQHIVIKGTAGAGIPEERFVTIVPRMKEKQIYTKLPFCYAVGGDAIRYSGRFKVVRLGNDFAGTYGLENVYGLLLTGYVNDINEPMVVKDIPLKSYGSSWVLE